VLYDIRLSIILNEMYMRKIVLVLGLLVMSNVMFAGVEKNPNSTSSMTVLKQGNIVKVMYSGLEERNVNVTIYNSKHKAVFHEEVRGHASFVRPYNLIAFPKGEYRIVMNDGNEIFEEKVSFTKDEPEIMSSVIKSTKDKFILTLYSAEKVKVQILLLDESGNLLYYDSIKLKGGNSRLFNLKHISSAVSVDLISEGSQKSIALK
jgi:hypothetical protein